MFRRDFFKMLAAAAASVVCAPLAKLLPERKPEPLFARRFRIGDTIVIKKPVRFTSKALALSAEDFSEHAKAALKRAIDAERSLRDEHLRDLKHVAGQYEWLS